MNLNAQIFDRAVNFLGAVLILCVAGIIGITIGTDDAIPDVLQNIAVGSLTGLVGLLTQRGHDGATPVTVVNSPVDPVPVDPA